ncbi:MAG: CYTH domain-containing protein, partial [Microbacterium sp.]|uniref:CYTH domain-containing protein n=1 Tax=Microbacterium sp. TaxID=51671 RepID=UPI0039E72831
MIAEGAHRSTEVEVKHDVAPDTPLPDWSGLPGVARVGGPELRDLDASYLDTDDLALGRAGYALRRRTGGPDAGWHIKGPRGADGGRVELQWPLADDVPAQAREAVATVTTAPLRPLARIRSRRTAYALLDARGEVVAEFVDDRVVATDQRTATTRKWREWEFELGPAAPAGAAGRAALLAAAAAAVGAAGGGPPA